MKLSRLASFLIALGCALSGAAFAQDAPTAPVFNEGNIAWMLTATAFVLLMSVPGLALF
jgi:Amt family ammonium transporter